MSSTLKSAGYPIISHFTTRTQSKQGGFNLGGINATGQVSSYLEEFSVVETVPGPGVPW